MNIVISTLLGEILYATTTCEVCENQRGRIDKFDGSRTFNLHKEIATLVQGTLSLDSYFTRLKELSVELKALVLLISCKYEKRQKLYQFSMGLNDNYVRARSEILVITLLPSINYTYAMKINDKSQKLVFSVLFIGIFGVMPASHVLDPTTMYSKIVNSKFKKNYILCLRVL